MNKDEIDFINKWSEQNGEHYSSIRALYRNGGTDDALESMFNKYGGTYQKDKPLYRGLKFSDNVVFNKILQNSQILNNISIDNAPTSFSKELHIAKNFAKFDDINVYSILIIVKNRITDDLEIEEYSLKLYQREVLV